VLNQFRKEKKKSNWIHPRSQVKFERSTKKKSHNLDPIPLYPVTPLSEIIIQVFIHKQEHTTSRGSQKLPRKKYDLLQYLLRFRFRFALRFSALLYCLLYALLACLLPFPSPLIRPWKPSIQTHPSSFTFPSSVQYLSIYQSFSLPRLSHTSIHSPTHTCPSRTKTRTPRTHNNEKNKKEYLIMDGSMGILKLKTFLNTTSQPTPISTSQQSEI